jgi:hypothetical protein
MVDSQAELRNKPNGAARRSPGKSTNGEGDSDSDSESREDLSAVGHPFQVPIVSRDRVPIRS